MYSLTLEHIYFIGQTVAAISIVVSLIYVGLQVRQNTIATESASAQAYVADINDLVGLINSAPKLADVMHQGMSGLSSLKDGDLIRFMAFTDTNFMTYQSLHLQWQKGTLDETLLDTYKHTIIALLKHKGQQEWWELRRHWFNHSFQNYIEKARVEGAAEPMMHQGSIKD